MKSEELGSPQAVPLPLEGIDTIDFGPDGLVPVVVQDLHTREVLMLAFINREMLQRTLESGNAWFWSRRRRRPWLKGETSGNYIRVRDVRKNCEDNSLLLLAEPAGPVCHTGAQNCYYRTLDGKDVPSSEFRVPSSRPGDDQLGTRNQELGTEKNQKPGTRSSELPEGSLDWLFEIVRAPVRREGSYVAQLLTRGVDRIAKKVGEEAAEVIIAAKNRSREELANEMADLWFHSLVLLLDAGMTPDDVARVLAERHRAKIGATPITRGG